MSPPRPLLPKDSGRFFVTVTLDFSHDAVTGQGFIALAALKVRPERIRSVLRLAFDDSRAGLIYRLILKENANRTIE
ncbi:hypothetical protein BLMD_16975 [Bacillus paralicheniformis]|nr:hypothetical protein BLMD_16975 [Bacillus paralicheniformis]PAE03600.1 hypothetical protein CHI13_12905 [Bacillus paralicheniformis]